MDFLRNQAAKWEARKQTDNTAVGLAQRPSNSSLETEVKVEHASADVEQARSQSDSVRTGQVDEHVRALAPLPLVCRKLTINQTDPFGEDSAFKNLSWWRAGALLIAETISLGILSLPKVVAAVGFVPAIILVAGLGLMATYTGYVVYQFKRRYMGVHSFANAANMIFGPIGKWIVEIMQTLILIFIMAAHILTFSIEMNVLTNHGTCTIVFGLVGAIVSLALTIPRTFKGISWFSIVCT